MKSPICPQCSAKVDLGDKFCRYCGYELSHYRMIEEQKLVTVIFSDLSGYSHISEVLDPEELGELMKEIFVKAGNIVVDYGGIVEKFIGDAIVALFGVPTMYEDDPVRAIRAAFRIHKAVDDINGAMNNIDGITLKMHTGINSGYVLVEGSSLGLVSPKALGSPINIASRLSDIASAGEILIGEAIYASAKRFFHLKGMGSQSLKGFVEPIYVYSVVSKRAESEADNWGSRISRFVGRDKELSTFRTHCESLEKNNRGAVICITGEPGIGKSRLIAECKAISTKLNWHEARCYQYTMNSPYFPFSTIASQILNNYCNNQIQDKKTDMREIFRFLTGSDDLYPYIADLCGFEKGVRPDVPPDIWKGKIFEAFSMLIRGVSKLGQTIICVEDIHWADRSSMELLDFLASYNMDTYPCIFLLSYRKGRNLSFANYEIHLQELNRGHVDEMINSLLGTRSLAGSVLSLVFKRTSGNPFYVEELVNHLLEKDRISSISGEIDSSAIAKDIPLTIKALIAARIDNLDPGSKRLLQEASVIAKRFSKGLLSLMTSRPDRMDEHLDYLMDSGLVRRVGDGGDEYTFNHVLTQEVAYESFFKRDRRSLHAKIASILELKPESERNCILDVLAHHFRLSGDLDKAIQYSMLAAKRQQKAGSWAEATKLYLAAEEDIKKRRDIIRWKDTLPEIWEGIWSCARIFNPDKAIYALKKLVSAYEERGLKEAEAFAMIRLINVYSQKGLFQKAIDIFKRASNEVKGDNFWQAVARTAIAYTYTYLGCPNISLKYLDKARPLFKEKEHRFFLGVNYITTLTAHIWRADVHNALVWYRKTRSICTDNMYVDIGLLADIWLGYVYYLTGKFSKAKGLFLKCAAAESKMGVLAGGLTYVRIQSAIYFNSMYMGFSQEANMELDNFIRFSEGFKMKGSHALISLYRSWVLISEGRLDEARHFLEGAVPGLKKGVANRLPYALSALAYTYFRLGDMAYADKLADKGILWNLKHGNQDQLIWSYRIKGCVATRLGLLDDAKVFILNALDLSRKCGMPPHIAWCLAAFGDLHSRQGDNARARNFYKKAFNLWQKMGNLYQAGKVEEFAFAPCL